MAISKLVSTVYGVDIPDAYIRVERCQLVGKTQASAVACIYAIDPKTYINLQSISSENFLFFYDINGDNPIKQAYQYLKTMPEYSDAVDC